LIEEQRTNRRLNSNTGNPVYPGSGVSHSTSGVGLDETTSATEVVITSTQGTTGLRWNGWSTSSTETRSFFVKVLSGSGVTITGQGGLGDPYTWNLSTKTYSSDSRHPTGGVYDYGNGWYKCWQGPTGTDGGTATYLVPVDVGTYLFWGFQRETGSFPTSYIPTTSSTVTRSADVASMTGTNFSSWYNQSEGSWYIDYNKKLAPVNISNVGVIGPQHLYYRGNSTEALRRFGSNTPATGIVDNQNKIALAYGSSDFDICANGSATVDNYSVATPTGQTTAHLMSDGSNYLTSNISRLTYYPKRLTNAQLQSLTRQ
jgi:hypothetical protein